MRKWKDVATLVKTKSLNGRFVARPAADFPFILEEGAHVHLVPPQTDLPREGVVVLAEDIDGQSYELMLDSVGDDTTARGLVGCHCLVSREIADAYESESEPASWGGWNVFDVHGKLIGNVVDLVENPGQSLLEVERVDVEKLSYIPVVEELIVEVDSDEQRIVVDLPVGLLDL